MTKKQYRALLEKLFTLASKTPEKDEWSDMKTELDIVDDHEVEWNNMMSELDTTFGQEEGYFKTRFPAAKSMFADVEGIQELCKDEGVCKNFYELVEQTDILEAFLEKTILVQMFKKLPQEEMTRFIQDNHYRPRMQFGNTLWMLTSSFGKHDFRVEPVSFELYHNFVE